MMMNDKQDQKVLRRACSLSRACASGGGSSSKLLFLVGVEEREKEATTAGQRGFSTRPLVLALAITERNHCFSILAKTPFCGPNSALSTPRQLRAAFRCLLQRGSGRKRVCWRGTRERIFSSAIPSFLFVDLFFRISLDAVSLCFSFSLYRRRPSSLSLITHRVPVGVQVRHVDRGVPVVCRELERLEREVHECRKEKKKTTKKEEPAAAARRMPRR